MKKTNNYPIISIITVTYNSERFLEDCIKSVVSQTYKNYEHIIIDGGSTDKTIDIIKKYSNHISYWVSEKDQGPPDAYNKGVKVAKGDLINFLNSDDLYTKNTLLEVARKFNENNTSNTFDMITCGIRLDYLGQPNKRSFFYTNKCNLSFNLNNILFKNFFFNGYFFKTEILKKFPFTPLFKGSIFLTNDTEHFIRLALNSYKNIVIDKPLYIYQASNLSFSFSGKNFVRQRIEWCNTAERFITSKAIKAQEKEMLQNFYFKSMTSLLLYYLTKFKLSQFCKTFKKELLRYGVIWIYKFIVSSARILYGKLYRRYK